MGPCLLRNCSVDHLTGREVDEPKTEVLCAVAEATEEAGAILPFWASPSESSGT